MADDKAKPSEQQSGAPDKSNQSHPHKGEAGYINSTVSFAKHDALMQDVVKEMIDKKISSVLVEDDKGMIVGIITERDIVRKFTLLDLEDKLKRTVATIMTRPVEFVQVKDAHKQIVKLHLEKRVRHFPVLLAKEPKKENLVGIVSITDVARNYMLDEQNKANGKVSTGSGAGSTNTSAGTKPILGVMASNRHLVNTYIEIFKGLGIAAEEVVDLHKFAATPDADKRTLILDMDGFHDSQIHELLPVVVKSKFFLILTTSKHSLIPVFKRHMDAKHQEIAMKPLDLSYLSWLLQKRWSAK
jgi:CBS domain-containing protein